MDVSSPEQAIIAQRAGACAVMAFRKIPADIRIAGGVAEIEWSWFNKKHTRSC